MPRSPATARADHGRAGWPTRRRCRRRRGLPTTACGITVRPWANRAPTACRTPMAMRRADLADDPRFATAAARRANFAELHRIVQNWILTFADVGALDAQLDEAKIAFGEVRSLKQLSEMEWAEYWDAVQEVSDRNGGSYRLPGRPWRFSRERLAPLGEPAYQGEHNRAVFAELGFSVEQIGGYVASGALVSASIPLFDRTDDEDLSPKPAHKKGQRHDQQHGNSGQHDER